MRLQLNLTTQQQNPVLPDNYQYPLSAAVYKIVERADSNYSKFLHETGYTYLAKNYLMRLYLTLSRNKETIPFNYQHLLTGVIHKWIGAENQEHGKRSFYSFSWLQNTSTVKNGINLKNNSYFFISAYNDELIKRITKGILNDPGTFCGSKVIDVQLKERPEFSSEECFVLTSPILLRKKDGEKVKHIIYTDKEFDLLLTESLKNKLNSAGLNSDDVEVQLDKSYLLPTTKLVDYKGIKNKTTLAPVIIKGSSEQIAFAWETGLGNSTGIGFGSLK
jgi:CRISPR-associated endoribonuclease Cas6